MKRKRIAVILGLAMTLTQIPVTTVSPVYAQEDTLQETEAAGDTEEGKETSPQKPEGEAPSDLQGGTPPQKPEGEAPSDLQGGTPPQKPEGEASSDMQGGTPPQKPEGEAPSDLQGGTPPQMPDGEPPAGMQGGPGGPVGGPGGSGAVESYNAVNEYEEDAEVTGEISSDGTDENAILVDNDEADVVIRDAAITRKSADSTGGDSSSFYGVGAAALAAAGKLYITDSTITTDAAGGAGVFAYGDGTVYIADTAISTEQGTSGGIHAAGGGTLYAWNVTAVTEGGSAAAIRSDRGGGTMVADGGSYTSNGVGSPAIYCTADITVNEADLTAAGSEAVCIEGLNTIRLFDCNLSGNMPDSDQNDTSWNVIVYQSMSGDSVEGNGTFEMSGGTLTAGNGGMFYTTNTESTITLKNVEITYADDNRFFLQCTGNANQRGWGSTGNNGADCLFTGIGQEMEGDVIWDSISRLDFYMIQGSSLTGAFVNDETWAGDGGDGYCSLYLDETSVWTVTGDSTLTALYCAGTVQDEDGNTVSVVGTDGTVYVRGDSAFTITTQIYEDTADTTGAGTVSAWEDYKVERPEEI